MKIEKLSIKNFKGIGNLEINTKGKSIKVYGDNGTGKTTISDAINWLLFGKDSQGNSKFALKPLDEDGNEIHYLETEVEAIITLNKPITLRKTFKEKWTRKRGTTIDSFDSHTTDYYIDDVPKKEKEFQEFINNQLDEKLFKLLTNPLAFNNLHWEERRKIMLDIAGDVSVDEIIDSNPDLEKIRQLVIDKTVGGARAMLNSQKKKINAELKEIPVRISELNNSLPVLPESVDFDGLNQDKTDMALKIEILQKQRNVIQKNLDADKKTLYDIIGENQKKINEHRAKKIEINSGNKLNLLEIESLQGLIASNRNYIDDYNSDLKKYNAEIESIDKELHQLREQWKVKDGEQFDKSTCICPTCNQDYPESQKAQIHLDFNSSKSLMLADITRKGQDLADNRKKYDSWIYRTQLDNKKTEDAIAELQKQIREKQVFIQEIDTSEIDKEIGKIELIVVQLRDQLSNINVPESIKTIDGEIKERQTRVNEIDKIVGLKEIYTKTQSRIMELKEKEKRLSQQYLDIEGNVFGVESFIKTTAEMLEGKLNSMFENIKFQLFKKLINGGLEETFECLVGGVPYNLGLNNGARINAGIEIINKLSGHYGFHGILIVDNSEAVTKLQHTDSQVIELIVSEEDKTLRIV